MSDIGSLFYRFGEIFLNMGSKLINFFMQPMRDTFIGSYIEGFEWFINTTSGAGTLFDEVEYSNVLDMPVFEWICVVFIDFFIIVFLAKIISSVILFFVD